VGPPLARPEYELPSYGRASIAFATGVVMTIAFLISTIAALVESKGLPLRFWTIRFWSVIAAGETAAWRLKWAALPIASVVLWTSARIIRSIKADPKRFIGLRAAKMGFGNAVLVTVLFAALIGITVPARFRQRQYAIDAAIYARGYTLDRAFREYLELHGTLPEKEDYINQLRTLPDPDGAIAEALRFVDPNGYQATTGPFASKLKPLVQRGGALRNTSTKAIADPPGVAFTSYVLRLPSEHRIFGGDDDYVVSDGLITKVSETPSPSILNRPGAP
jgi:hypothetical protein